MTVTNITDELVALLGTKLQCIKTTLRIDTI